MTRLHAPVALLPNGWAQNVRVKIAGDGRITAIEAGVAPTGADQVLSDQVLLPAIANTHSHGFQRCMAGLTEARGPGEADDFWSWRDLMYRLLAAMTPDDVEAITALAQLEMLHAGFCAVGEFHYLHHGPDGSPYEDLAEMAGRVVAAAETTGIGLTLLPVLYSRGGLHDEPLAGAQRRFGNELDRYARLLEGAARHLSRLPADARLGIAPHSLRAVRPGTLTTLTALRPGQPRHIHIAEQTGEVVAVEAAYGRRPVQWLLEQGVVNADWCLVHATHTTAEEITGMAAAGAVAGLCPITEANLGDGIFDAVGFKAAGGQMTVGSDSNVLINLAEEIRLLEYGQRLSRRQRAMLSSPGQSTGVWLWAHLAAAGARALGRDGGRLAPGALADLVALETSGLDQIGVGGDALLDGLIFARAHLPVAALWVAGRPVIEAGRHRAAEAIRARAATVLRRLRAA